MTSNPAARRAPWPFNGCLSRPVGFGFRAIRPSAKTPTWKGRIAPPLRGAVLSAQASCAPRFFRLPDFCSPAFLFCSCAYIFYSCTKKLYSAVTSFASTRHPCRSRCWRSSSARPAGCGIRRWRGARTGTRCWARRSPASIFRAS